VITTRFVADTIDNLTQEAFGRVLVTCWTSWCSRGDAVLIDGSPQSVSFATDLERHLIQMPLVASAYTPTVESPPDGVAPSGLGFIYLHGGGYSTFDKGGSTEPWFRHLAAQAAMYDVARFQVVLLYP
jgi:acetyl esterase/lipase